MSIADAIEDFANSIALAGGTVTHVDLDERAYDKLMAELAPMTPVDPHEVCGDYDRPSSPWFGSRPMYRAVAVWSAAGVISIGKKR